jgi:hypothetical protein
MFVQLSQHQWPWKSDAQDRRLDASYVSEFVTEA